MYILGINAYHGDSSACLLKDGEVVIAIEEERIRRIKHWAGFPVEAIKLCLQEEGLRITDVDYITVSKDPWAKFYKKVLYAVTGGVNIKSIIERRKSAKNIHSLGHQFATHFGVQESDISSKIKNIEHHRSHLASAFFASPYKEAALLSIDGSGDFTTTMTGIGTDNKIKVLSSIDFPHSIGVFYTAITQYLGFANYGDEYKVMGLAPYGKPNYVDKLHKIIQSADRGRFSLNQQFFRHAKEGVNSSWENCEPTFQTMYSNAFIEEFGPVRLKQEPITQYHKDLASSAQKVTEDIIMHILNHLHKVTGQDNLCVAGGVAQNSVANGKIVRNTPFKRVYIPPSGHDGGTSMGSALYLYNHILGNKRVPPILNGCLGSSFSLASIQSTLDKQGIQYKVVDDDTLYDFVTDCLIKGGVVGWFQGRAEFGPRALGNRSILVDPRRTDAKELLNQKIKRRESFRPFAPSILREFVDEYFELNDEVPFMEKVFPIRKEKHAVIPAVTHVDGTGRLQTVDKKNSPRYYNLINTFFGKTGVPILLNTSFNENEPIVNSPLEALDCYLRTKMDILVVGNVVIEREHGNGISQ